MLGIQATQKRSATLQLVDCNRNLDLKWSFEELQIKLLKRLLIRCSRKELAKRNQTKHNCFGRFWTLFIT